jgi:hypothetical protein
MIACRYLDPNNWTDADWIDAMTRLVAHGHPFFVHLPVYNLHTIIARGGQTAERLLAAHALSVRGANLHNKVSTTSINVAGSHWVKVFVDWSQKLIIFVDPGLQFGNEDSLALKLLRVAQACNTHMPGNWRVVSGKGTNQKDGR